MNKESLQSIHEKTAVINTVRSYGCVITEAKKLWWRKYAFKLRIRINEDHPRWNRSNSIVADIRRTAAEFDDVKTRYEWYSLYAYFRSEEDLQRFLGKMEDYNDRHQVVSSKPVYITELEYYPVPLTEDSERNIVVCNNLPFKKYRFKVFIDHREIDDVKHFVDYFESQCKDGKEPFRFTGEWQNAIRRGRFWYGSRPYLYVEDEKQMTILGFYAAQSVKKIDEYRTKNELNISE